MYRLIWNEMSQQYIVVDASSCPYGSSEDPVECVEGALVAPSKIVVATGWIQGETLEKLQKLGVKTSP